MLSIFNIARISHSQQIENVA